MDHLGERENRFFTFPSNPLFLYTSVPVNSDSYLHTEIIFSVLIFFCQYFTRQSFSLQKSKGKCSVEFPRRVSAFTGTFPDHPTLGARWLCCNCFLWNQQSSWSSSTPHLIDTNLIRGDNFVHSFIAFRSPNHSLRLWRRKEFEKCFWVVGVWQSCLWPLCM